MNIQEAQELLPFYVNGTLDRSEKEEIEALMKDSPVLQEGLRFWQSAAAATHAAGEYGKAGHPTGEQIVDYAQGRIRDPLTRISLEHHIQGCQRCHEEVDLVRKTVSEGKPEPKQKTIPEKLREIIDRYKLTYLVPALAVSLFVILLLNRKHDGEPTATNDTSAVAPRKESGIRDVLEQIAAQTRTSSLVLEYRVQVRGQEIPETEQPVLRLDSSVTNVNFVLLIPGSRLRNVRYRVALRLPSGKLLRSTNEYQLTKGKGIDTLSVTFSSTSFPAEGNELEIHAKEILPREFADLTPEEYRFPFRTRGAVRTR